MGTLLLVDDEPSLLASLRRLATGLGLDVVCAHTAHEAITALMVHDVVGIITDFHMPKMNGVEFLKLARTMKPGAFRVGMTGMVPVPTPLREALRVGLIGELLAKPLTRDDIVGGIKRALARPGSTS